MKPNFVGIGAQKCATTWVYRMLDSHPQVFVSEPKELHFFSYYFDHGFQWYEHHFEGAERHDAVGEYSTTYLYDADAPRRLHEYNPTCRLIVTLRDPVSRAYSNHLHEVRAGHVYSEDRSFEHCAESNPMYLEQGYYARHLSRWLEYFPADSLLVLFQEVIETEPETELARLYRFLGVNDTYTPALSGERFNKSAQARKGMIAGSLRMAAKGMRRVAGDAFVRNLKSTHLAKSLNQTSKQDLQEVIPPMQEETRRALCQQYADDMQKLADMLGMNQLPWKSWKNRPTGADRAA